MTNPARTLIAAAAAGGLAAPGAAQYQQQYPQTYPQYQQQYGYGQGYDQDYSESVVGQVIDQLLGNRYNVTDRQAVSRCARAALIQARQQYGYYGGYGYQQQGYAYPDYRYGYQQGARLRVTAITDVERRYDGLRVRGLIGPSYGYGGYGGYGQYGNQYGYPYNQYGYQYRGYGYNEFSFRCTVDYRGTVTGLRVIPENRYRRY